MNQKVISSRQVVARRQNALLAATGLAAWMSLPKTATGKIQKYVLRTGAPNLTRQQAPAGRESAAGGRGWARAAVTS